MGRTGYCHDDMRDKLDGQNLIKVTAGRADRLPTYPGSRDNTRRSEQKMDDLEKYKEKLRTELQKTARKQCEE